MNRAFLLALSVLGLLTSASLAEDWRQFRGPGGQGASPETGLPATWSDTQNLVWKTQMPGFGASSPITLGNRVYVTCYSGYGLDPRDPGEMSDLRLHVVSLDRNNGQIVWNKSIEPKLPETERVRDHGYAAATPVTDGKHLFVFFGKSGVFKLGLDGSQVWHADVGSGTDGWGSGTSPVLHDDLVIVNASVESKSLVALDQATGREAWRAGGMQASWNTPHLVALPNGQRELVVSVKGSILGFNPSTGEKLWACDGIPDYVCPSLISRDGIVYAIGGRTSLAIAVRAGGRGDVTDTHRLWEAKAGANVSSPVIHGDYLYWVSDRNRTAYCVRLADGEVVYSQRLRGQPYASATVADGKLYVVTRHNGTFVLAAQPRFEQLAHNTFDDDSTFNASPAVSDGRILLRSDRYLYCIGNGPSQL